MSEATLQENQTKAALAAARSLWSWGFYDLAGEVAAAALTPPTLAP